MKKLTLLAASAALTCCALSANAAVTTLAKYTPGTHSTDASIALEDAANPCQNSVQSTAGVTAGVLSLTGSATYPGSGGQRAKFANAGYWATGNATAGANWFWGNTNQDAGTSYTNPLAQRLTADYAKYFAFTLSLNDSLTTELSLSAFSFDYRVANNDIATPPDFGLAAYINTGSGWNALTLSDGTNTGTCLTFNSGAFPFMSGKFGITADLSAYEKITSAEIRIMSTSTKSSGGAAFALNNITVTGEVTPVPEPSTYALFGGLAFAGLALVARRRKQK